jgi:prepilin peptidase CpaA
MSIEVTILHFALSLSLFLFCMAVIYGAICDVRTYTIPNGISYGLILLFIVFAILVSLNPKEIYFAELHPNSFHIPPIAYNFFYGLVVFVFFVFFWRLGWVGGGDVKFISAISLFMGLDDVLAFVVLLSVIALAMVFVLKSIPVISVRMGIKSLPQFLANMVAKIQQRQIPYGVPAAMAALIVIPDVFARVY